jgi:hypothetical protein
MIGGLPDAPPAVLDALRVAARRLGDAAEDLATSTERAESQPSLEEPLRASVGQGQVDAADPPATCSCGAPHPSLDPSNAAPSGLGIPLYDCPRCGSTCGPLEAP